MIEVRRLPSADRQRDEHQHRIDLAERHLERREYDRALPLLREALARDRRNPMIRNNLAFILLLHHRYEEALTLLEPVGPVNWIAALNLGQALHGSGRTEEGLAMLRPVALRDPSAIGPVPDVPGPMWDGSASLAGRQVLFCCRETGLGDQIQIARWVGKLAELGASVLLRCDAPLERLFTSLPGAPTLIGANDPLPPFDYHVPAAAVALLVGPPFGREGHRVPYLRAEPERVALWRERLRPDGRRLVGVHWQCATYPGSLLNNRAFPLRALAPLAALPGMRLISLQRGAGTDQLHDLPPGMVVEDLGPDLDAGPDAFLDTAVVMESLDLVISCDTAIPHLAGALGRPTWLALPHRVCWIWFEERRDSPWYPTMRLFRQKREGEWAPVFAAMRDALQARLYRRAA